MKYTILFIAICILSAGVLITACKKKSTSVGCYVCTTVTKIGSNIPVLDTNGTGTLCNYNSGMVAFYIKTHTKTDTFYFYHDTVETKTYKVTCVPQ